MRQVFRKPTKGIFTRKLRSLPDPERMQCKCMSSSQITRSKGDFLLEKFQHVGHYPYISKEQEV